MQALHDHIATDGFRLRGVSMSRVDGFSDVVFGFALTLLVVSLEVPRSFAQLHESVRGFLPFAICFLLLMSVWYTHFKFFRRFGLHDVPTIWLNGALLFFILFYVYPLKFLFTAVFDHSITFTTANEIRELTLLYALGFGAIYLLVTLLYMNAWRQRDALQLTPHERALTRHYIGEQSGFCVIALIACIVALLLPAEKATLALWAFALIAVHKSWFGRRIRKLAHAHARQPAHPEEAV